MTTMSSRACVSLPEPEKHLKALTELMAVHDIAVIADDSGYHGTFRFGEARLKVNDGAIILEARAADLPSLNGIKLELTGSLSFVSGQELPIEWTGNQGAPTSLPKFCVLTVASATAISPCMRRIVFSGEDLGRFAGDANLHMRLAFPQPGTEPAWPKVDGNGRIVWPGDAARPVMRKYTIRAIDPEAGTVTVDFVLHDDAGPGARFAANARPGDIVGMIGPGGLSVRPADWYLLAGDETALPAIGRILEFLPASAKGIALIEVASADEEQDLSTQSKVEVRWLHRNGSLPGASTLLADAVRHIQPPADGSSIFAWAAGEYETFKSIRRHLRNELGLGKAQHLVVSYWRRGKSEDEMENAPDRER